jgi:hypothetical protein
MKSQGTLRIALVLMAGLLLSSTRTYAGERQIRGFVGATFGGKTTFVDPELVAGGGTERGKPNPAIGASAVFLGEMFGIEIEVADAPGFFQADKNLVRRSRVTTISGNVIVAAPRRMTEYSLRPYIVAGAGLMHVAETTSLSVFDVSRIAPSLDVGVGVIGFVTNRFGVSWDVRRFQIINRSKDNGGLSFGDESLSFWRATMAVALRY